jgi:HlyD family secretion protein
MSLTTSAGTRLTRRQTSQMPALLEFYSPSAALLETREKGPARGVIWSVASLFVGCTLAAALIPIDMVVTAPGKVTAMSDTIVVQPLETSIIREIDVQEGQVVHKGDLLARLDPTFSGSDQKATTLQLASLRAEVERRRAEAAGVDYRPTIDDQAAQVQEAIFAQRRAERTFRLQKYQENIDGLRATLAKAMGDIQAYTDRMSVATTVEGKRRELEKLGWGSQLERLAATDQRLSMLTNLQQAQQTAKTAATDLQAMKADMAAYDLAWKSQNSSDLTDASRKLDDMQGQVAKADLRSHLVELRADADATVLTKAKVSVGSVLQSGDQFLTLVPLNAPLEVDAMVAGNDAGFVHVGNKVAIKFDTFPFTHYGEAKGTVQVVSPDSFVGQQDENQVQHGVPNQAQANATASQPGQSYYRVRISIDSNDLHDTPPGFHITPGMPITSDVLVGKRTVLTYIFSRALPVVMDGMREP